MTALPAPALSALLDPADSARGPRPPPPPRASLHHFDAIIDYLLANPGATMKEIGAHIRRGNVWVSMVIKSDAFVEHYKRRREVINTTMLDGVQNKLAQTALKAAAVLVDRLETNPLGTTVDQLTTIVDKTTARLGFGATPPTAPVSVSVSTPGGAALFVASPEQIAAARARLRVASGPGEAVESDAPLAAPRTEASHPLSEVRDPAPDSPPPRAGPSVPRGDVVDLEPVRVGSDV